MKDVTKDTFEAEVLEAERPVVVDLWASWCGPCKVALPKFEDLSKEREDAIFVKVNVDDNPELVRKYGIRSIPTFMIFKGGVLVETLKSADMDAIKEALDTLT